MKFKTVGSIKIYQSEFCKPCEQNLTVDDAQVIYGDQTAFVKCIQGFQLIGSPFIHCLRTSKWELSKLPSCKIIKCSPLKTPANGRFSLTKISYNGRAKFTCEDGFDLIGSEIITCMATGNWSDNVPHCKSIYECPALDDPPNGVLIYATDSGIVSEKLSTYPIGTFVQVQCNSGFNIDGENLISCTEQGSWDFDVEDCELEETTTESSPIKVNLSMEFLKQFKEFTFYSCKSKYEPKLCRSYSSDFNTDLTSFELPETAEYEGMDAKLSNLLINLLDSNELKSLNTENFLRTLLRNLHVNSLMRDSYRFVICLYIDLILIDNEIYGPTNDDDEAIDNINENIKRMLKRIAIPIYEHHLKNLI